MDFDKLSDSGSWGTSEQAGANSTTDATAQKMQHRIADSSSVRKHPLLVSQLEISFACLAPKISISLKVG